MLKTELTDHLYNRPATIMMNRIRELTVRNAVASGHNHASFLYKNEFFTSESRPGPRMKNRLLPKLVPEMEAYLADRNELTLVEMIRVLGYITLALNATGSYLDYLELFPPNTHPVIARLQHTFAYSRKLSDEEVATIISKNQESYNLLRKRLTINLII
jgi:hypothetical protein